ncbi:MAG: hypothetical protein ACU0CI_12780 [Shimia sp.]
MQSVIRLPHGDAVQMDEAAISQLMVDLGRSGAEDVINRAMEAIALRLTDIERLSDQGDLVALRKASKGVIGIAEQIGLLDLADAARALADAAPRGDANARAATVARVSRVGDLSLSAIWARPGICL